MPDPPSSPVDADELGRIADQASLGLIRFDAGLRVSLANVAAHHALERRPGSLNGRSLMEAFVDHRLEELVRAAARGETGLREIGSGERARLVVRARPASGGGAWVTLENVTALRRLERIRTEFIDNLSHELRTPLANIRLLTEMLTDELASADVPQRVRDRVATIDVESGHLAQMVNELLDLSRIEQATSQVRADDVAVEPLVAGTLDRLRTFADRQHVELRSEVPTDLPHIRGEEERLGQLLVNLLHNAIKFSPDGGVVTVGAEQDRGMVVVSVVDQGEGIPKAEQSRVFERFYKVDRARQRGQGGTGLGLAIARHIAEAHGGRIWVESADGAGTTLRFSIPIV
jgi:two-component system, OmpR family, phosphate regulon sensor histidine kinase PhoR